MRGNFDDVREGTAYGWAWVASMGNKPVTVQILANGKIVAQGLADMERGDLASAGIGNGKHAFAIRLPKKLFTGKHYELKIMIKGTRFLLEGSPKWVKSEG